MPNQIEVCNLALTKLGADRITDIDENIKEAREISAVYDMILRSELEKYRWAFATKRASLAALVATPDWGYSVQYQLPIDCASLIWVDGAEEAGYLSDILTKSTAPYKVEGRRILTNLSAPLKIQYIALVSDPNEWAAIFVDAFASRLAFEICESITQSGQKKAQLWAEYLSSISTARQLSAIQDPPMTIPDDSWLQARA